MAPDSLHKRILDNLKTAVVLVEPDLCIAYVNPAAEDLLETSGTRVQGAPITSLFTEGVDTLAELRESVRTGAAYTKRETVLTLPGGASITVDYAVTPLVDETAAGTGTLALALELQPLDRLLRISRDEGILSSQESTQALMRGLAHEIKNPLGGLRGAAQLLARELPDSGLKDYTNIIIEEADRLRDLVDQMLGPNKLPERRRLNIHEVSERVRQLLEVETLCKIRFERDYDPSIPELMGDRQQLIQAVLNVARNAVEALQRASPPGQQPCISFRTRALRQFTIGAHRHRLVVRLDVNDNGSGIAEAVRSTLFLPMVSGRPDGTGLGLSIAQSIVNRHQGLIECNSRPGMTQFSLFLPLEQK